MAGSLPDGLRRRGKKIVVTGHDPWRAKGSIHVGTVASLAEARRLKADFESEKGKRRSADVTVGEWADIWTTEPRWQRGMNGGSESTDIHNHTQIRPFVEDFRDVALAKVTRPIALLWLNGGVAPSEYAALARGWAGSTEERGKVTVKAHPGRLPAIRAMFTDAKMALDSVVDNPFSGLQTRKGQGRKDIPWLQRSLEDAQAQLEKLYAAAHEAWDDRGAGDRIESLIKFAAYSGMRPGEIFALRWSDIDFRAKIIHVEGAVSRHTAKIVPTKNHQTRQIVLLPQAEEALSVLPRVHERVFLTLRDKPMSQRTQFYYWDPVRRAYGDSDLDFYELRHFCGSYLASLGLSAQDVATQLGHTDGGQLAQRLYIHTFRQDSLSRIRAAAQGGAGG